MVITMDSMATRMVSKVDYVKYKIAQYQTVCASTRNIVMAISG